MSNLSVFFSIRYSWRWKYCFAASSLSQPHQRCLTKWKTLKWVFFVCEDFSDFLTLLSMWPWEVTRSLFSLPASVKVAKWWARVHVWRKNLCWRHEWRHRHALSQQSISSIVSLFFCLYFLLELFNDVFKCRISGRCDFHVYIWNAKSKFPLIRLTGEEFVFTSQTGFYHALKRSQPADTSSSRLALCKFSPT